MPSRRRRIAYLAVVALGATLLVVARARYRSHARWQIERRSPSELAALLRPAELVLKPDGAGPFPAVLMFHGCGGIHAGDRRWAELFREHGMVVVQVDSLGPRGLQSRISEVCRGDVLSSRERAGDVLVTLAEVRNWPFIDGRRIVLAGWSHGGTTIMDLLSLDGQRALPLGLSQAPDGGLDGVAGILLLYPYAGFPTLSTSTPWRLTAPTLMLLAGNDTVVPTSASLAAARFQELQGRRIEVHVYDGVDHAWDQQGSARLRFDERATADARARVTAWLDGVL